MTNPRHHPTDPKEKGIHICHWSDWLPTKAKFDWVFGPLLISPSVNLDLQLCRSAFPPSRYAKLITRTFQTTPLNYWSSWQTNEFTFSHHFGRFYYCMSISSNTERDLMSVARGYLGVSKNVDEPHGFSSLFSPLYFFFFLLSMPGTRFYCQLIGG